MKIKRLNVAILPVPHDDGTIELRVDVRTEHGRYGYYKRLPADQFESLFERVMHVAAHEIKERTFDVSDVSAKEIGPENK